MDLVLDGTGPVYQQIARAIRSGIVGGRFVDGSRLPPSRDLADELKVSRTTVIAAYQMLRSEGVLDGKVGSGSYVRAPRSPAGPRHLVQRSTSQPQSAYSRRARALRVGEAMPTGRAEGVRHAFVYSFPIVNTALPTLWARAVAKAAAYLPPTYPPTEGLPALREALARHIAQTRGVVCGAEDILIVSGAQQAFDLVARVVLDQADGVVLEEPSYDRVRKLFQVHGAQIVSVPVDEQGIQVECLSTHAAKLIYVTPSHQFPTGVVMSRERRQALLDVAGANDSWICEDDFDGEFRQEGLPVPSLRSLDRDGRVIYVGSFSKTLFPALRLGYLVMPSALREDFIAAKKTLDLGSAPLEQAAMAQFISSGAYDRHLRVATLELTRRRDALKRALRNACGATLRISPSHCGMHLMVWIDALSHREADAFLRLAASRGIGLYTVNRFYAGDPPALGLLMGYSAMPRMEIPAAVQAFAACLDDYLAGQRAKGDA